MSDVGVLSTETHWLRAVKAHGGPSRVLFMVETWWPLTDPAPGREGR